MSMVVMAVDAAPTVAARAEIGPAAAQQAVGMAATALLEQPVEAAVAAVGPVGILDRGGTAALITQEATPAVVEVVAAVVVALSMVIIIVLAATVAE